MKTKEIEKVCCVSKLYGKEEDRERKQLENEEGRS